MGYVLFRGSDISPMESLWGVLVRCLYPNNKIYNNTDYLLVSIKKAWTVIQRDSSLRSSLIDSMPSRLSGVLANKGWFVKY
jgi:hypothetical protein